DLFRAAGAGRLDHRRIESGHPGRGLSPQSPAAPAEDRRTPHRSRSTHSVGGPVNKSARPSVSPHRRGEMHCFLLAIATLAAPAWTHPAIGIVMDATGAVFYTDTAQVWRIAPDGTKSVVLPGVHTHELWLDREGNLYGEHLAGGNGWTHRIWRRTPD